ncbi:MAG: hypothetical protein LBU12_00300 [Deltaproteobacteria bacterium]|jgi:hypothetical protein|nr:hypothetical protein [Deltaproteobacteria bacterium]
MLSLVKPSGGGAPLAGHKRSKLFGFVAAALVVLLAAFLVGAFFAKKQAKESFSRLMDQLVGQDLWRVESFDFDFFSRTLTVQKLSVDLSRRNQGLTTPLTVESLELKDLADAEDWGPVFARGQWTDRRLAERLALAGLVVQKGESGRLQLGSLTFKGLDLAAASDGAVGLTGLLNHLRAEKLLVEDAYASGLTDLGRLWSARWANAQLDAVQGPDKLLSTSDWLGFLISFQASQAVFEKLVIENGPPNGGQPKSLSFAALRLVEADGLKFGQLTASGVLVRSPESLHRRPLEASLAQLSFEELDLGPLADRLRTAVHDRWLVLNDLTFRQFSQLSIFSSLDLFFPPGSARRFGLTDLELDFDKVVKVSLAQAQAEGPFEVGRLPLVQSWRLDGLKIELPDRPTDRAWKPWHDFAVKFGRHELVFGAALKGVYDPKAGTLAYVAEPLMESPDLFALKASWSFEGLAAPLAEDLARLPLNVAGSFLELPEAEGLSLSSLRLEFENRELFERFCGFQAAAGRGTKEEVKKRLEADLTSFLTDGKTGFEDPLLLAARLLEFVQDPKSLTLASRSSQRSNLAGLKTRSNLIKLFNSLQFGLTVNGQTPVPLILSLPSAQEQKRELEQAEAQEREQTEAQEREREQQPEPSPASLAEVDALLRRVAASGQPLPMAECEELLARLENTPGAEDALFLLVRRMSKDESKWHLRLGAFFDPLDPRPSGSAVKNVKYAYDEYVAAGVTTESRARIEALVQWLNTPAASRAPGARALKQELGL